MQLRPQRIIFGLCFAGALALGQARLDGVIDIHAHTIPKGMEPGCSPVSASIAWSRCNPLAPSLNWIAGVQSAMSFIPAAHP